jgi:hypothetical protein
MLVCGLCNACCPSILKEVNSNQTERKRYELRNFLESIEGSAAAIAKILVTKGSGGSRMELAMPALGSKFGSKRVATEARVVA